MHAPLPRLAIRADAADAAAFVDIELRSKCDLRNRGVDNYARDASTAMWCLAFAIGDGPVQLLLPGDPAPLKLTQAPRARRAQREL